MEVDAQPPPWQQVVDKKVSWLTDVATGISFWLCIAYQSQLYISLKENPV